MRSPGFVKIRWSSWAARMSHRWLVPIMERACGAVTEVHLPPDCSDALRDGLFSFHSVSKNMDSTRHQAQDTAMNRTCKLAHSKRWFSTSRDLVILDEYDSQGIRAGKSLRKHLGILQSLNLWVFSYWRILIKCDRILWYTYSCIFLKLFKLH